MQIPVEIIEESTPSIRSCKLSRSLRCLDCGYEPEVTYPCDRHIHGPKGVLQFPLKVSGTSEALECPECESRKLRKLLGGQPRKHQILRISVGGRAP